MRSFFLKALYEAICACVRVDREVLKIAPSKGETSLKDHYAHAPIYKFLKSKMVMSMCYLLCLTALVSSPSVAGPPPMITMSVSYLVYFCCAAI